MRALIAWDGHGQSLNGLVLHKTVSKNIIMSRLAPLVICTFLIALVRNSEGEIYFRKGAPHVQLANKALISGKVQFSRDGRPFTTFAGIPYATVPERFAESELIHEKKWEGVREMVEPGPVCPQQLLPRDVESFTGEEDCLSLNVHVPMNNTGKNGYPVMVWIHGGGFLYGFGAMYGPKYFMDEDVILVTFNYRLGVLGFLSTGDEVVPGNNGLKDQVNALRWVKENIRNFHGDPDKVTIFGESAGGASVHHLTLSPLAKGLFHRAISQSGTALASFAHEYDPKGKAEKFAKHLGCPISSSLEIVTCLKGKSTKELNRAQNEFFHIFPENLLPLMFGPTTEPKTSKKAFLTQSPWSLLTSRDSNLVNDVPLMIGAAEHEGVHMFASLILENEHLLQEMNDNWDEVVPNGLLMEKVIGCPHSLKMAAKKIKEFYFETKSISQKDRDSLTDMFSDGIIFHSVYRAALETASRSRKSQVYLYQYAHQSKLPLMNLFYGGRNMDASKTGHADEIPFLFNIEVLPMNISFVDPDSEDETFSKNLVGLWASFAKHGEPKHVWGNVEKWNPISKKETDGTPTLQFLKLDKQTQIIDDIYQKRMSLWNSIWEDILHKPNPHKSTKSEL